jgi:hypothetical protein
MENSILRVLKMKRKLFLVGSLSLVFIAAFARQSGDSLVEDYLASDRLSQLPPKGWVQSPQTATRIAEAVLKDIRWIMVSLPTKKKVTKENGYWKVVWIAERQGQRNTGVGIDIQTGAVVFVSQSQHQGRGTAK